MVFLVAISLIVLALMTWVGTSLSATSTFANERSLEYAATNSVNLAIQNTRYTFATQLTNASPPQACWYDASGNAQQPQAFNGKSIDVWCSTVWQPFSANTRTITYSACPSTVTNVNCAAAPLLQAIVAFDDYAPGIGVPSANPVQCNLTSFCGQSMTQLSWQWRPAVPSVSSLSPTSGSINGGTSVTISGNGFVNGSSVNFVQETGPNPGPGVTPKTPNVPTSANGGAGVIISIPSSQVTWGGCSGQNNTNCTLTVTSPAVTSGTDYFVTVTAPGGTSAYVPTQGNVNVDDFQYTAVAPVVTGISGTTESNGVPGGSITGGSVVTISGSGFYSAPNFAAQVWFWSGGTKFQSTNVNISSNGTMTATAPAVSAPGNYYVQVVTIAGSSTNTSDVFNYGVQVPIIISMSPSSGGTGTQITITGGNFLVGSTVVFYQDVGGNPSSFGTNASATVNSQSSMTVTVPGGLTAGQQYFPVITLPSPYDNNSSQTYNEPADIFTRT